jgi:hypothetical protein
MPVNAAPGRYFFHVAGDLTVIDPTGGEFLSDAAAKRVAERHLRHLRQAAPSRRVQIDVCKADGQVLFEVDEISDMSTAPFISKQSLIEQRAHEIWDREGRPAGREQEHWNKAVQEIEVEANRRS